jgi:hypothetical protein
MMLPSERLELAIYQAIKRGPAQGLDTSVTGLFHATGENDNGAIVERLKDLDANGRIILSKYSGRQLWPRGGTSDRTFFYTTSFLIQIAPSGRKYFEDLEQRAERKTAFEEETVMEESSSMSRVKPQAHVGPLVLISHSSKDVDLATALIELLKAGIGLLADQIRCSSVDGYRLPVGVNTETKLREEVNTAAVVIGLITPSSLSSHYVMFELGARWGAGRFIAPLLAGVEASKLSGPLSLLNALSANNDSQLHQLLANIADKLGMRVQAAASYVRNVSSVKALADTVPNSTIVAPVPPAVREQLKVAISAEGTPPSQVLRVVANRPIEVSRVEYMLSSEATIASEDVSKRGGQVEIPINDGCFIKLWNTPRSDRNHYDHSGPAKMAVTISADGDTRQYILPVQMEAMPRKIVGSKTFYWRD